MEVYHAGINDTSDLCWAFKHILSALADMWTPYLNQETDQGKENTLMVAKWLCDLKEKVHQDFVADRTFAAKNVLSNCWLVTRGMGTELFTLKKDIGIGRRFWETLTIPSIVPRFIVRFLWNCEEAMPEAQLAMKYTAFAKAVEAQRIHLDSCYTVKDYESVAESCARMGAGLGGFVKAAAALGLLPT